MNCRLQNVIGQTDSFLALLFGYSYLMSLLHNKCLHKRTPTLPLRMLVHETLPQANGESSHLLKAFHWIDDANLPDGSLVT